MRTAMTIGIVILCLSSLVKGQSQEVDYMQSMAGVFDTYRYHSDHSRYLREAGNPLEFIFAGLFLSYKVVFSSQDMDSCVFSPSCSAYGMQAIQKRGILLGAVSTFDRLSRCHPFASGNYPIDPKSMKLYDPVD